MITIEVLGTPQPGGSKVGGVNKKTGKGFCRPDNPKTAIWRSDVSLQAAQQYTGSLLIGPTRAEYEFRFARPKSHYGTGKNANVLKKTAPIWHTTKPDLTKLVRSTEDSLTSIVWRDDSRSCINHGSKRYCNEGERPGATIIIIEIPNA